MMKPLAVIALIILSACQSKKPDVVVLPEEIPAIDLTHLGKAQLSEYGFFQQPIKDLNPVAGVIPYTLNAVLFTDYAYKKRFIKIPEGTTVAYNAHDVFEFPVGTILIKNFYYPADFNNPTENLRLLETRLLINEAEGWKALPYIWNEAQTDAFLNVAGKTIPVSWKHTDGQLRNINYTIPNLNQCKGCHLRGDKVMPIGPAARQLNGDFDYAAGKQNQLIHWQASGVLSGLPKIESVDKLVSYDDKTSSVSARARAWLEINCAHCHRADGPAKNSGLYLLASETTPARLGIGKAPVAAGKGSGGLLYGIVPGKPDASILQYRIESVDPGVMMPELGRSITHTEGVALVRQWIMEMK
ncbi:MAG: hypothetical protein BroJett042_29780 [Bacteroidota bacterium]|nr:MAG: hypothetical protein BroJett042_29780 [Bacteroidota bacterium]